MASISTSLSLQDRMTNTLMRQIAAVDKMINRMEKLDQVSEQIDPAHTWDNTTRRVNNAYNSVNSFNRSQQSAQKGAEDIKNAWSGIGGLIRKASTTIASAFAVKKGIELTFGGGIELDAMQRELQARLGNDQIGTAMFQKLQKQAQKSAFSFEDLAKNTLSFMSMTTNPKNLDGLNQLAERLAVFDKTGQGLEGAGFSLKEALSGDIVSLAERFNMSKAQIRAFGIDELGKKGDIEGFIKQFNKLLEAQNMGEEAYQKMLQSPKTQLNMFLSNMKTGFATASQSAVEALAPLFTKLNEWFASDQAQSFFNAINMGLNLVSAGLIWITNGISWVGNAVQQNWGIIEPILMGAALIGLDLLIWKIWVLIAGLWQTVAPISAQAAAWMIANWPILLVITAIVAFIEIMRLSGATAEQVIGFISGTFAMLFSYIANALILVWNIIASFAEFLINIFIDPVYAVKKLVYDLEMAFLKFALNANKGIEAFVNNFISMFATGINKVIGGINWLIDALNKIPGFNIGKVGEISANTRVNLTSSIQSMIDSLEAPTSNKNVWTAPKMEYINGADAFNVGQKFGQGIGKKIDDITNKIKTPTIPDISDPLKGFKGVNTDIPNIDNVGKVGEVGKIKDDVNIAEEDLKLLRDIAEARYVQNFVTLTPQVSLSDIKISEKIDLDEVTAAIERKLEDEFVVAAEGVYS